MPRLLPLASLACLLASCDDPVRLNDGPIAYWEVPQTMLDTDHPRQLVGGGFYFQESITTGDCLSIDGQCVRIRLAFRMEEWKHQHEVCHAIDKIGSDMMAIRRALGSGCPPCVYEFLDACQAYQNTHPTLQKRWAWQVLQNMYPRDNVINHPEIVAELRGYRPYMPPTEAEVSKALKGNSDQSFP